GTQLAAKALRGFRDLDTESKRKKAIVRAVEKVAKHLGNTPAICRRCYIHPAIFEGYVDGTLLEVLAAKTDAYLKENIEHMSPEEAAVTAYLRLRLAGDSEAQRQSEAQPRSASPRRAWHNCRGSRGGAGWPLNSRRPRRS